MATGSLKDRRVTSDELDYYSAPDSNFMIRARHATILDDKSPTMVYALDADLYHVDGETIKRPKKEIEQTQKETFQAAEYIGPNTVDGITETEFVVFHLDSLSGAIQARFSDNISWGTDEEKWAVAAFLNYHTLTHIHELIHWGLPHEDQPTDDDHWTDWNNRIHNIMLMAQSQNTN